MNFTWQDGERTIRFGRGAVADAPRLLGDSYTLLTTERARAAAPEVVEGASAVHVVGPGLVDELAAELHEAVGDARLIVALGGGRVVDVAKALAGVRPHGTRAAAIPTTLSAAEMTRIHRTPAGHEGARNVRAAIVVNDPDLSASQPTAELAASSANALAHAVEAPVTTLASPVPTLAAREAMRLIDVAWLVEGEDPSYLGREQLAQAALLSGYAIDATRYGLSHVMSQTLVRVGGAGHGQANAAVLPVAIGALEQRNPGRVDPDGTLVELARRLARRAGADGIRRLGVDEDQLEACARAAAQRPDLRYTPPAADAEELLALYRAAW
ncbi:MAG TPA: iron-containing alcohol dehydrogenase [Baekduia sp.]|uniref:iron-containing alcohol dehydrogenase n=1 Tax=Baekduia sp. TaxID=2600305 RepID=UPI002D77F265|nr:iron-containing alcohol dehydrogenase [Baekduia sp.]HET6505693.1 iron-containing alcohol dehydrogenase [Baekduia sp.]